MSDSTEDQAAADITGKLLHLLEARRPVYLDDLRTLTSIDCPSGHKSGLDEVAAWIAGRLRGMGWQVELIDHPNTGMDVKASLSGSGTKRILLLCHTDTVYPVGTVASRPVRVEGTRIVGPGVCDMKAGILSALYAVEALQAAGWSDFGLLQVLCNSDEEAAPRHSVELIQHLAQTVDCVFCMEAGRANGDIVSARKGVRVYQVTAHGREAHAGVNPGSGRNAIVALAQAIVKIAGLNGRLAGITVSPGLIRGGSAVNTVPAEASCDIDVRVSRLSDVGPLEAEIRRLLSVSDVPDVTFDVHEQHSMPPMEKTEASSRLVELAGLAASEIGFAIADAATGGGSDGAYAAATGTPVLDGLGPVGGNAHSEREYVDVDSIVPRTAMLARLITLA